MNRLLAPAFVHHSRRGESIDALIRDNTAVRDVRPRTETARATRARPTRRAGTRSLPPRRSRRSRSRHILSGDPGRPVRNWLSWALRRPPGCHNSGMSAGERSWAINISRKLPAAVFRARRSRAASRHGRRAWRGRPPRRLRRRRHRAGVLDKYHPRHLRLRRLAAAITGRQASLSRERAWVLVAMFSALVDRRLNAVLERLTVTGRPWSA